MTVETAGLLWHGTPDRSFSPLGIEPRHAWIEATFLTGSPMVAAYYAGATGVVHAFEISESAALLDVSSNTGPGFARKDFHYPDVDVWISFLDDLLSRRTMEQLTAPYAILDPSSLYPNGPDGQPSWERAVMDNSGNSEAIRGALLRLGMDGILRTETSGWGLGDRGSHFCREGSAFGESANFAGQWTATRQETTPSSGFSTRTC